MIFWDDLAAPSWRELLPQRLSAGGVTGSKGKRASGCRDGNMRPKPAAGVQPAAFFVSGTHKKVLTHNANLYFSNKKITCWYPVLRNLSQIINRFHLLEERFQFSQRQRDGPSHFACSGSGCASINSPADLPPYRLVPAQPPEHDDRRSCAKRIAALQCVGHVENHRRLPDTFFIMLKPSISTTRLSYRS